MRRRGLQESDAQDASQQVLLRISGAIERYEPDGAQASFRRWLYCIARNVVVTFLTRQSRQRESLGGRQPEDILEREPAATAESDLFDHEWRQARGPSRGGRGTPSRDGHSCRRRECQAALSRDAVRGLRIAATAARSARTARCERSSAWECRVRSSASRLGARAPRLPT